jgi:hypothetical protein
VLTKSGKPRGNRQLGRKSRRWEGIIKLSLKQIGCNGTGWIQWTQFDRWWADTSGFIVKKDESIPVTGHRVVRCRGSDIF